MAKIYEAIMPDDARLTWGGAVSLQQGPGWVMPWRLPYADRALFPPLQGTAAAAAGVRLRFATDAASMIVVTEPMEAGGMLDLFIEDALHVSTPCKTGDMTHLFLLPGGKMQTMELWLSQKTSFRLREIRLNEGATLAPAPDPRPRWIVYGSSITHGGAAAGPSRIWSAVVARASGLNLTCLGYSGQCHADPMLARMIRDLPAELITLKLGINIYGAGSLNARSFLPAVLGTIATIRDGHPETPLVVCSPIWSPPRETTPNVVGMTLEGMREEVERAVALFRERGDDRIHYVNGLDLFGAELHRHLPDGLHPDTEGHACLGANFIHEVFEQRGIVPAPVP